MMRLLHCSEIRLQHLVEIQKETVHAWGKYITHLTKSLVFACLNWQAERRNVKSKYRSKKVEIDGIIFDSKREAKRYSELKILERTGAIQNLQMQVKYILIPSQYEKKWNSKKCEMVKGKCIERECAYIADFVYWDNELDKQVVEDTKGFKTKDYIIKRKLMLHVHGIRINEI